MTDDLLPAQEELLDQLVEATQKVPRHEQQFTLLSGPDQGPAYVVGAGVRIEVLREDVWALDRYDYVSGQWYMDSETPVPFTVTRKGYDSYRQRHAAPAEPAERIEEDLFAHLSSEEFSARYPEAFTRWSGVESLLRQSDPQDDLTTIGHKAREALQQFATALVERHKPPDVDSDPAKTINRLRAVIEQCRGQISSRHAALLDALVEYWNAVDGVVQRQEHGDQKGGEPVTWEDARTVVVHTALVMFEIDRLLGPLAD